VLVYEDQTSIEEFEQAIDDALLRDIEMSDTVEQDPEPEDS